MTLRFLPPLAVLVAALVLAVAPSAHAQTNPTAPLCTTERFHQGFNHLVSANWTAYDRDTDPFRVLGRGLANQYIEFASWNDPSVHPASMQHLLPTSPAIRDGTVEVYANVADRVRMQNIWNSVDFVYAYGRGPMLVLVQKRSYFPEQAPIFETILGEACP
jgi:hypothetical protein